MRQSYFLSILLIVVLGFSAGAQSSDQVQSMENGLYKTFEDLKNGQVVTDLPYREDTKSSKDGVTRYNLFHEGKYRPISGIFCFVNSNHIYLNGKEYGRKGYYIRSHFVGRYAYFEDRLGKEQFEMKRSAPGMVNPTGAAVTSKIWGIVLDMETGKVYKTSRWRMKRLLASYPKLWKKYKEGGRTTREVYELIEEISGSSGAR